MRACSETLAFHQIYLCIFQKYYDPLNRQKMPNTFVIHSGKEDHKSTSWNTIIIALQYKIITPEGYSANEILLKRAYNSVKKFEIACTLRFCMPVQAKEIGGITPSPKVQSTTVAFHMKRTEY